VCLYTKYVQEVENKSSLRVVGNKSLRSAFASKFIACHIIAHSK